MVSLTRWTDAVTRWFIYLILLLAIYILILKLPDHGPVFETLIAGGIIAIAANMGRIENHMDTTKRTFGRVWHELDEIKRETKKIDRIEERLGRIEKKLGI